MVGSSSLTHRCRNEKVKVWLRTRPTVKFAREMIHIQHNYQTINLHMPKDAMQGVVNNQPSDWSFKVDGIMHNASQDAVFNTVGCHLVSSALDGYNGTLMCYGQTGAGKTFTITGATEDYHQRGLIPRALQYLYGLIEERQDYSYSVRISYLEIYNEIMFDLLTNLPETLSTEQSLQIAEDKQGIYVRGLSSHLAQSAEEALNLLFEGETNRVIASHSLNRNSSRSHCIFTVYIEARSRLRSDSRYLTSKLNFVDLAGSERLKKTKSEGRIQQEAMYINKSLSFLEQTVIALADRNREHIPFRQSKLTHYLKDSIGGHCSTLLVANIWPERSHIEETISTLRFALRMMCVTSEPILNEHHDPMVLVNQLETEITNLKRELAMHDTLANRSRVSYEPLSQHQRVEIRNQVRRYLSNDIDNVDVVNLRQLEAMFEFFREIYSAQEKDIEQRYKDQYILLDRTDVDALIKAKQSGVLPEDVDVSSLVGETDRQTFGIGVAPKSSASDAKSLAAQKRKERQQRRGKQTGDKPGTSKTPTGLNRDADQSPSTLELKKEEKDEAVVVRRKSASSKSKMAEQKSVDTEQAEAVPLVLPEIVPKPSTPPSRQEAFEEFKRERGSEIHRILVENKEILISRKKAYSNLARQVNSLKTEIDNCRQGLQHATSQRESEGFVFAEGEEAIISEDEFAQIHHLKHLKQDYRTYFEQLKGIKAEIQYCERLVDQCRHRLVQEFDKWFNENYLGEELEPTSADAGYGRMPGTVPGKQIQDVPTAEDEGEQFDRLQRELLQYDAAAADFVNARAHVIHRKAADGYNSQAQPWSNARGYSVANIRGKPSPVLQV